MQVWTTALLVWGLTAVITQAARPCPRGCNCRQGQVNCYGRRLRAVPGDIPRDTTWLDLQSNEIDTLDHGNLHELTLLEDLRLRYNHISTITPRTFHNLRNLKKLNLGSNRIHTLPPAAFSGASSLLELDLTNNEIKEAEGGFSNLTQLIRLDLSGNTLSKISDTLFKDLQGLFYLILSSNKIWHIDSDAFTSMPRLSYIKLNGNPLRNVDGLFRMNLQLTFLDFSDCKLRRVPSRLPQSVRYLQLNRNRIRYVPKDALSSVPHLSILMMDDNSISTVEDGAFGSASSLQQLWLNGNNLTRIPKPIPAELSSLWLGRNSLTAVDHESFAANSKLKTLSLNDNKLTVLHGDEFTRVPALDQLNLSSNSIQVLKNSVFSSLRSLTVLTLDRNALRRIEPAAFQGLQSLEKLEMMSMPDAETEIEGDIFSHTPSLQSLSLRQYPSFASYVVIYQEIWTSLRGLQQLDLRECGLSSLVPRFQHSLPSLTVLHLSQNPWVCDQHLLPLHTWMLTSSSIFASPRQVTCASPLQLKGRVIAELRSQDMLRYDPTMRATITNSSGTENGADLSPPVSHSQERTTNTTGRASSGSHVAGTSKPSQHGTTQPVAPGRLKEVSRRPGQSESSRPKDTRKTPKPSRSRKGRGRKKGRKGPKGRRRKNRNRFGHRSRNGTTASTSGATTNSPKRERKIFRKRGRHVDDSAEDRSKRPGVASSTALPPSTARPSPSKPDFSAGGGSESNSSFPAFPAQGRNVNANPAFDEKIPKQKTRITQSKRLPSSGTQHTKEPQDGRESSVTSQTAATASKMKTIAIGVGVAMLVTLAILVLILIFLQRRTTKVVHHRARQYRQPGQEAVFFIGDQSIPSPATRPRLSRTRSDRGSTSSRPSEDITNELDTSMKVYTWDDAH